MGLYLSIPGTDFSTAPGKIGTASLIASANDPLPVLALPGLSNWWSAEDASVSGGAISWTDRVGGAVLAGPGSKPSPVLNALTNPAVGLNGAAGAFLSGTPVTTPRTGAASWLYVLSPSLLTQALLSVNSATPAIAHFLFNDGHMAAQARNGEQVSGTSGKTTALAAFNGYIAGNTLTITSGTGAAIGQVLAGTGIAPGTKITAGSGSSWTVDGAAQTVGSSGSPIAMWAVKPTILVISWSGDGANGFKFANDGVFDKQVNPATLTNNTATPTAFRFGADVGGNNRFTGLAHEMMQFDRDILAASNATYYNWLIRRFKARYGIA